MALQVQRKRSVNFGRLITTAVVALAFVAQPMYGMVASQVAKAASNTVYTDRTFNSLDWVSDRKSPSGVQQITSNQLTLGVDSAKVHAGGDLEYHRMEGLRANLSSGVSSVRASLFIDSAWQNVPGVEAGLWTVTESGHFPKIAAKVNASGQPEIQAYDFYGNWLGAYAVQYGDTVTLGVSYNIAQDTYEFHVNDTMIFSQPGWSFGNFDTVIFNNKNLGGVDNDYTVSWSNLQLGVRQLSTPTAKFFDSNSSERSHTGWTQTEDFTFKLSSAAEDAATGYQVRYWNDIEGKSFRGEANAWTTTVGSDGIYKDKFSQGEGVHYFSFRTQNAAGNWSEYSAPFMISYDRTPPTTTLEVSKNAQGLVGNTFTVSGESTDNLALNYLYVQLVNRETNQYYGHTINLIPEGKTFSWSKTFDATAMNLPEGTYMAHVAVTDMAGNTVNEGWTGDFTLDKTLPSISISSSQGDEATKTFREVSFKLHDATAIDRAELNGKPFTSNHGSVWGDFNSVWANRDWSGAQEGDNTLVLFDMAGNSVSYNFRLDNTAPVVSISGVTEGSLHESSVAIAAVITDENHGNYYLTVTKDGEVIDVPGIARNGSADSLEFTLSEVGSYQVKLEARDKAGNKNGTATQDGESVKTISFSVVAPAVVNPGEGTDDSDGNTDDDETGDTGTGLVEPIEPTTETAEFVPALSANGGTNLGNPASNFAVFTLPGETATTDDQDDTAVLGAQTDRNGSSNQFAAAVPTADGWKIFGLMWYWWLLIVAAVAGAMWLIGARRRSQDDAI